MNTAVERCQADTVYDLTVRLGIGAGGMAIESEVITGTLDRRTLGPWPRGILGATIPDIHTIHQIDATWQPHRSDVVHLPPDAINQRHGYRSLRLPEKTLGMSLSPYQDEEQAALFLEQILCAWRCTQIRIGAVGTAAAEVLLERILEVKEPDDYHLEIIAETLFAAIVHDYAEQKAADEAAQLLDKPYRSPEPPVAAMV